jgi:Putative cyclase
VLEVGEEFKLTDLKDCLARQGLAEDTIRPGDAAFVRTGHGTRWYTETRTFYDGEPGIGLECARWFSGLDVCIVGADNFAVEVVPPVDPEVFRPCHQHLITENGRHDLRGPHRTRGLGLCLRVRADPDRRRNGLARQSDRGAVKAGARRSPLVRARRGL